MDPEYEFWLGFLEIYKENPCLWDPTCVDYSNISKRNLAYGLLVEKLWELNENADIETVKKKIESFRSLFRREINKVRRNEKLGKESIYKSTWNYFDALSFLASQEQDSADEDNNDLIQIESVEIDPEPTSPETSQDREASKTPETDSVKSKRTKRRKVLSDDTETSTEVTPPDFEDDCSTFAAHLKTRMRAFDPQQKCIAQKLISNILFLAETKQLQLTSEVVKLKPRKDS